jgi:hypothetical protein
MVFGRAGTTSWFNMAGKSARKYWAMLGKKLWRSIRQQNLRVAGYPRFEPAAAAEPTQNVQFSATFEVYRGRHCGRRL